MNKIYSNSHSLKWNHWKIPFYFYFILLEEVYEKKNKLINNALVMLLILCGLALRVTTAGGWNIGAVCFPLAASSLYQNTHWQLCGTFFFNVCCVFALKFLHIISLLSNFVFFYLKKKRKRIVFLSSHSIIINCINK